MDNKNESILEKIKGYNLEQDINHKNQVFLIDEAAIDKLILSSNLNKKDIVLEIGPGIGEITRKISYKVKKVIAIELDEKFKDILSTLPKNVELIFDDAKKYLINERNTFNKLVSSPPYNLCEPLMHILTRKPNIEESIFITPVGFFYKIYKNPIFASFFTIEKLSDIEKESFYPIPRIDSEIIRLKPRPDYEDDKDDFSFLVRSIYIQKDKKIKNAIKSSLISLYKLKNKILTKKQAKKIIDDLKLDDSLLTKKMQNFPPSIYEDIVKKIIKKIK